jgi:hypothetical protein
MNTNNSSIPISPISPHTMTTLSPILPSNVPNRAISSPGSPHTPTVYYYTQHIICTYCDSVILQGQKWIKNGCMIQNQVTTGCVCSLAGNPVHVECFLEHIKEQTCKSIESWYIDDPEDPLSHLTHPRCFYWHKGGCLDHEDHKLLGCPLGCKEYYRKLKTNECIEMGCWMERHLLVCPELLKNTERSLDYIQSTQVFVVHPKRHTTVA